MFKKKTINRVNTYIRVTGSFMPDVGRVPIAIKAQSSVKAQRKLAMCTSSYMEPTEKNISDGSRENIRNRGRRSKATQE